MYLSCFDKDKAAHDGSYDCESLKKTTLVYWLYENRLWRDWLAFDAITVKAPSTPFFLNSGVYFEIKSIVKGAFCSNSCLKLVIRRGTEEVRVTPIISGSDFRIVLAPAISVEKQVTVKSATVAEHIRVCGWSLEFNVVTDVDCFLNKKQVLCIDWALFMSLIRISKGQSVSSAVPFRLRNTAFAQMIAFLAALAQQR